MSRRGATSLSGILPLDKPAGMTSHDVVARLRRATGERRIGHAGTLDPMATGLLLALVGPATRLEPYLSADRKSYLAQIVFGTATDTEDAEGDVVDEAPVPANVLDGAHAEELLGGLLGASMQHPPVYSAIKTGGRTAHRAIRAGESVELAARPIEVYEAILREIRPEPATWVVEFTVSKGTYVRSLARDLGVRAGTVAHLGALRRTASGPIALDVAVSLDAAVEADEDGRIEDLFIDPVMALGDPATIEALPADVRNGRPLPRPAGLADGALVAVLADESLQALYRVRGERLVPEAVLAIPIRRRP